MERDQQKQQVISMLKDTLLSAFRCCSIVTALMKQDEVDRKNIELIGYQMGEGQAKPKTSVGAAGVNQS